MEISVIIPVYNRAHMIGKALESLKMQSFKNFDVIIVDDGSSDSIKDVVSQYRNALKIIYVYFKHCGNIAFLRNQGIKMSNSRYIAILDSDDWCIQNRFEKQINYMKEHENCDILASWVWLEDEFHNDNAKRLKQLYNMKNDRDEIITRCLNDGCCICNSTVMMKRDRIVELGGYDEDMYICEDFNLWLKAIVKNYDIEILQEKLVVRKIHVKSVTSGYDGADLSIRLVIRNKMEFLKMSKRLKREICVWGVNARNNILFKELKAYGINNVQVIDVYNEMSVKVNVKAYHLVTTFTKKNEVFEHLNNHKLKIVEDYIYA